MRNIFYIALLIFSVIMQVTFAEALSIKNVVPDFSIIVLFVMSMKRERYLGTLAGFGTGLLFDSISAGALGLHALAKTIAVFISGSIFQKRPILHLYEVIVVFFFISFVHFFVLHIVSFIGKPEFWGSMFRVMLPAQIYTVVVMFVAFYFLPASYWRRTILRLKKL